MATIPAILLSILLPAAEPLTPAELDLAVAALEESLSRYTAIEATYSIRYESVPGQASVSKATSLPPATITWIWKYPQELISTVWTKVPEMPIQADEEIKFDGTKSYWLVRMGEESGSPDRLSISPGPVNKQVLSLNYLSCLTGARLFMRDGNLLTVISNAKSGGQISGTRADDKITVSLGPIAPNRAMEVDLDRMVDHRVTGIRTIELDTGKNFRGRKWEFVVDEFQSVADETTGEKIWFPLHARFKIPAQIVFMDVATVRINHDVAADTFAWREPKIGTEVTEISVPGGK
jgi:hypothetical protein